MPKAVDETEDNVSVDRYDAVPADMLKAAANGEGELKNENFSKAQTRVRITTLWHSPILSKIWLSTEYRPFTQRGMKV